MTTKKETNIFQINDIVLAGGTVLRQIKTGAWVPARPIGKTNLKYRLKAAWMVFAGKADVVVWPGQ
ncbi:hypothetical protein Dalk_4529 [Desulfatibacillum aliphaticivorans]|uniref:Uncharacterized protein n=1 Tax=Desulfatibacillum aliphaticivorans TaxID=218208 RepID=B8FCP4_DESAL|nr:hypothetical protein [Desulfatibacillum aliphaticivorans]ACL06207.1 hypothetical protein Dalk_4529 [Desulfatibacillum aliphaticivorans]